MGDTEADGVLADVSSWSWLHWTGLVLSICIGLINLYIGYTEGQPPFLVVGAIFLLGVVLFGTRFWNSILYLASVVYVGVLGVFWILDGMPFFVLGVATGLLSVALAAIALYLFYLESPSVGESNENHRRDSGKQ